MEVHSHGLIVCRSCGHGLRSSDYGQLDGGLNPSCLVCRRQIRNASYHRRKFGPKPQPPRGPWLYELCNALDRAALHDLSKGVEFKLLADGTEPGTLTVWRPSFQVSGVGYAPTLFLFRMAGREALLTLECGIRPPASYLLYQKVRLAYPRDPGTQLLAPPEVTPQTEIINSANEECAVHIMEWNAVDRNFGVESLSKFMNLHPSVVAYLFHRFGWEAAHAAKAEERKAEARKREAERDAATMRWIEEKRKEMGLPPTPDEFIFIETEKETKS